MRLLCLAFAALPLCLLALFLLEPVPMAGTQENDAWSTPEWVPERPPHYRQPWNKEERFK